MWSMTPLNLWVGCMSRAFAQRWQRCSSKSVSSPSTPVSSSTSCREDDRGTTATSSWSCSGALRVKRFVGRLAGRPRAGAAHTSSPTMSESLMIGAAKSMMPTVCTKNGYIGDDRWHSWHKWQAPLTRAQLQRCKHVHANIYRYRQYMSIELYLSEIYDITKDCRVASSDVTINHDIIQYGFEIVYYIIKVNEHILNIREQYRYIHISIWHSINILPYPYINIWILCIHICLYIHIK